jgi:hypothetical protein
MLSKYGGKSTKSTGGLNVSDNSNDNHGRSLENGNGIDNLALVHEGTRTINSTNNVGHTSLVSTESGEVGSSRSITVLGERTDASEMVLGTLLGKESKMTVTGGFELTVGHD